MSMNYSRHFSAYQLSCHFFCCCLHYVLLYVRLHTPYLSFAGHLQDIQLIQSSQLIYYINSLLCKYNFKVNIMYFRAYSWPKSSSCCKALATEESQFEAHSYNHKINGPYYWSKCSIIYCRVQQLGSTLLSFEFQVQIYALVLL